tara:strand:+ start:1625 stop:1948 length:324 start_codon:yes stop_codon:yes gene_type:complete
MSQHVVLNAKQWLELNKFRKHARGKLYNRSRSFEKHASDKIKAAKKSAEIMAEFDATKKFIIERRIDLLDECICDFVVDQVNLPENVDNVFVNSMMHFYETITGYRA